MEITYLSDCCGAELRDALRLTHPDGGTNITGECSGCEKSASARNAEIPDCGTCLDYGELETEDEKVVSCPDCAARRFKEAARVMGFLV